MSDSLRDSLLRAGFGRFDGQFAGGQTANNKLQLGYEDLRHNLTLRARVVHALIGIIRQQKYRPDAIVPVPEGADGYGKDIACALGIACIRLEKDPATKALSHRGQTEQTVREHKRLVIIEDVPNKLTSVRRVLDLPGLGERVVGVAGIWDRGDPAVRRDLPIPLHSLVAEYIPPMLPIDSEYWQYEPAI